jgi:hypothetical protein
MNDHNSLSYPHSSHRRYVRGCAKCLERSKAGAARLTESRRRERLSRQWDCGEANMHAWTLGADDMRTCTRCYERRTL